MLRMTIIFALVTRVYTQMQNYSLLTLLRLCMVLHLHILLVFYLLNNLGIILGLLASPEIKPAKTTGDRTFTVAAPVSWNALPPSLRAFDNINSSNN